MDQLSRHPGVWVDIDRIVFAIFGAFVGALGWLLVGMFLQRRDAQRRAMSAARALWFEIDLNLTAVELARDHGVFTPLSRTAFDRLLPDMASSLPLADLKTVAVAYQGHAGYEQASRDSTLPDPVRRQVLARLADATAVARDTLAVRAFGADGARLASERRPATH